MPKPKKLDASTIKVQQTPMLIRKDTHKKIGKQYQMSLTGFIAKLFRINEQLPRDKKMSDAEIARQIRVEYSHDDKTKERFSEANPHLSKVIAKLRSEYNRGKLTPSIEPPTLKYVSFSYDLDGDPVNTRFAIPKKLSTKEVKARRERYIEQWRKPWEESRGKTT